MTTAPTILPTAGLIVIKDNQILLAFSSRTRAWYLPGGKIDAQETAMQALQREIEEELNIRPATHELQYYCHISAPAYGESGNVIMEQDCYLYQLDTPVSPGREITGLRFFDPVAYSREPAQVAGVLLIFHQLRKDGLLA